MPEEKFNKFSVPLGLLDYVNPVLYTTTMITIIRNIGYKMIYPFNHYLFYGVVISAIFGFIIPTGKVLVGLGVVKFSMPVGLVLGTNIGILISGLTLIHYALKMSVQTLGIIILVILAFLIFIYFKTKKFNTVAVLTGAIGYMFIYISLIIMAVRKEMIIPIILYGMAISLFVTLCAIGIKSNLKNPKVHWAIEIMNVLCQFLVCISTFILFSR